MTAIIESHGCEAYVPRVVSFITVKRNAPLLGRSYGHWWLELDESESYGWWPAEAVSLVGLLRGTPGVLNGVGTTSEGTPTRDANHGMRADHEFHPVLVVPHSDDELRCHIRRFAATCAGPWRWSTRPTLNCRLFQLALFDAVGLVDGTGNYYTRGFGCPALASPRRVVARITGRRRWPRNLPAPGKRAFAPTLPGDASMESVIR